MHMRHACGHIEDTRLLFGLVSPTVVSGLIVSGDQFFSRTEDVEALRAAVPDGRSAYA